MEKWNMDVPTRAFAPPVYQCRKAKKPFVLDGNVDKEFWQDAPFTDLFIDIEGEHMPKPHYDTRVKMLWDDENLYFGAVLEGDEIWANLTERDCIIFFDNDFEIFIDPDSDTHRYYEFEMNALNTVWDLFLTKPYRDGGRPLNGWDIHGLKTAVKIEGELNKPGSHNKRWMAEIVMPLASLCEMAASKALPEPGDYYRLNFSRVMWDVDVVEGEYKKRLDEKTKKALPERNWVWAPTGVINIHYPEYWGFLFFTEGEENYTIPEKEKVAFALRQIYYYAHCFGDKNGYYTTKIEELGMPTPCPIDVTMEVTSRGFLISTVCEKEGICIYLASDGEVTVENL